MGALITGVPLTAGVFWLPVLIAPLVLAAFGLALGLSSIGVFWRDTIQITQFLVLALMFASAIFYLVSQIPPTLWLYLRYNPLLLIINEARGVSFWGLPMNFTHLAYLYGIGIITNLIGATFFQRLRSSFADVL